MKYIWKSFLILCWGIMQIVRICVIVLYLLTLFLWDFDIDNLKKEINEVKKPDTWWWMISTNSFHVRYYKSILDMWNSKVWKVSKFDGDIAEESSYES